MNKQEITVISTGNSGERRNILLYCTSKTVSLLGSALYSFALSLYVLKITGSPLSFAITLILGTLPTIVIFPIAGVIADKYDKKSLVVAMDLACGVLLLAVFIWCSISELHLMLIFATTFILAVLSSFFGVSLEAAKPHVVTSNKLMDLNSISKVIDSATSILGPMLGGVVYAFIDIKLFIMLNAITFLISGLSLVFIDFKLNVPSTSTDNVNRKETYSFFKNLKDGIVYLRQRSSIMNIFFVLILLNFFLGYAVTVPLPYIITTVLQMDAKEFGIIQATLPVGMIIGAMVVKQVTSRLSFTVLIRYISFSLATAMIFLGIPPLLISVVLPDGTYVVFYGMFMLIIGITIALIDIPLAYTLQTEVQDEYRGRVLSIGISIAKLMVPLAMIVSGLLLNYLPAYLLPISGGTLYLAMNIFASKKGFVKAQCWFFRR